MISRYARSTTTIVALVLTAATAAAAKSWNPWGPPVNAESLSGSSSDLNTADVDGCPIISPYDGSLYMASDRPGGSGGLDIWIAPRNGDGWGAPVNAGTTINTSADEFCPAPARGNRFFFVRRLSGSNSDIYVVKKLPKGWGTPSPLPRGSTAVNSPWDEWSPSVYEAPTGEEVLYFSSTRVGHPAQDVYYSVNLGIAQLAQGNANSPVNSAGSDARPNVSRDGLELVWDSTRSGSLGATDIWSASRSSVTQPWGPAVHLGNTINSISGESRPSLSWDGTTLVFGSGRSGGNGKTDIYVSTRTKITGQTR